jgi:prepilin-type N-terminal cleavage/methylation domain-containing protein
MKIQTLLKFLNISRKNNNSSGFTLIELLIAASISSLIIGVAGWGLVTLMSSKKASDSQSDKQGEINRASDFINDEIRKARFINKSDLMTAIADSSPTYKLPVSPGASLSDLNEKNVVLALTIPDTADAGNDDELVIYYTKSVPQDSTTRRGPIAIYRWGPTFDANGAYSIVAGNLSYTEDALIDGIKDTDIANLDTTNCPIITPSKGYSGLFACLGGKKRQGLLLTDPEYYTTAQLNINGVFKKATDNKTAYSGASDGSTQTASRINDSPGNILSTLNVPSYKPSKDQGSRFQCITNVLWRIKTTISIDGIDFTYNEGDRIDNLTNLINRTSSKSPDPPNAPDPTNPNPPNPLAGYKLSKDGKTLKVEKRDSSGAYQVVQNGFKVKVTPYVMKDGDNFVNEDPITKALTKIKPDGTADNTPVVNSVEVTGGGGTTGCNNLASQPVTFDGNQTNKVKSLVKGDPFPPNGVPLENVQQGFTYGQNNPNVDPDSTVEVLKNNRYIKETSLASATAATKTYETTLENDEIAFLFEIGRDKPNLDTGGIDKGYDFQDKMITLSW